MMTNSTTTCEQISTSTSECSTIYAPEATGTVMTMSAGELVIATLLFLAFAVGIAVIVWHFARPRIRIRK